MTCFEKMFLTPLDGSDQDVTWSFKYIYTIFTPSRSLLKQARNIVKDRWKCLIVQVDLILTQFMY